MCRSVITHFHHLDRLLVHAFRPSQLGSFLRLSGPQQDFESLLDVVHQILRSIRVVQQILADNEVEWCLARCRSSSGLVVEMTAIVTAYDIRGGPRRY